MDKPVTLPVKEWIIRNMSVKMGVSERVIEAVVTHQFTMAQDALKNCKSFEFSGFGKFYFNQKKAEKKMRKYLQLFEVYTNTLLIEDLPEKKRHATEVKLAMVTRDIEILKPKIDGFQKNLRGMEEQAGSTCSSEGTDSEGE